MNRIVFSPEIIIGSFGLLCSDPTYPILGFSPRLFASSPPNPPLILSSAPPSVTPIFFSLELFIISFFPLVV